MHTLSKNRMASSMIPHRRAKVACDRCYELKEKCTRKVSTEICSRCNRLALVCSTIRPVKPVGRRLQRQKPTQSLTLETISTIQPSHKSIKNNSLEVGTLLQDITDLTVEEKELLIHFLGQPENLDPYVICSSFQVQEQRTLVAQLPSSWPILKDAYLACARALRGPQNHDIDDFDNTISLRHASSAMMILQSLPVTSIREAKLCLALGSMLALFVYSAVGEGVADICHYCLSITGPFLESVGDHSDTISSQSFLVLLDTMDCLVHRQKPTLRFRPRITDNVDCHLGLCLPLLPHLYDLCTISHSLRENTDTSYSAHITTKLQVINTAIEAWQPSQPDDFLERFKAAEVVKLLAQARVYRLAGLLISHRLRYVFGQQDAQAEIWSREIMMELELTQKLTKQPIRCVTLPFVVAAVEVRSYGERQKTLRDVEEYVDHFTPVIQAATKIFLERVWEERDVKITSCWLDSVHKPCIVLNSIDAACFG